MKAGRELDALVVEKLMGWWKQPCAKDAEWYGEADRARGYIWIHGTTSVMCTNSDGTPSCPNYSTNIADAWAVVETVRRTKGLAFSLGESYLIKTKDRWRATFGPAEGFGETAAQAICLAALKSSEVRKEPL